jgi:hypothetical protein
MIIFECNLFHVCNKRGEVVKVSTVIGLRKRLPFVDVVVARSSGSDGENKGKEEPYLFDGSTQTHLQFQQSARALPELTRMRRKCLLHISDIATCAVTLKIY